MKILSKLDNTGMIDEVADKRYVTDAEKLTWNSKSDTDTVTTINGKTGAINKADIVALGISEQGPKGDKGADGTDGTDGEDGAPGADGITPHIGVNGNWYLGETDTGVKADGAKGDKGDKGNDGHTPIKGTDYWTTADKAAIVADVLVALPDGDGVMY